MRNNFWFAPLFLALAACGNAGGGDGGNGLAAVQPSQVDPAALRSAVSDERAAAFYEARQWQPAWTAKTSQALVEAIDGADRHGLDSRRFLAPVEQAMEPAAREAALTLAALDYAQALARGAVDPARLRDVYELPRPQFDPAAALAQGLETEDLAGWYEGLAPQDEEYRALSEAYMRAVARAGEERPSIADGPIIRPGGEDPRLPAIAAALRADRYLAPVQEEADAGAGEQGKAQPRAKDSPAGATTRYGPELVEAVRRLQQDHGLEASGVIGEDTLAVLNGGSFDRARILAVNLERRRWLERQPPATRIDVNTAAATLAYWQDGQVVDRRPVVVGQPGNETPALASPFFRLVANPTWTVPRSIQKEEIEPKGAAYMNRNNMRWKDGYIVQGSGPDNALGLVKFDMKNDHAIYLHDTPAKALFDRPERHHSHGCVRVEDALGFAEMIAERQGISDQWQRARAKKEETFVNLPTEIPVRLLYHSAFLDSGRVALRPDPYGWDDEVAVALGLASRPTRAASRHIQDVGP